MRIHIITLFPNEMSSFFNKGLLGRALDKGLFDCRFINLRDFADPPHYKVDDYPFGKRQGMLLKADVLERAITSIDQYQDYKLLYTCPKGDVLSQGMASNWSTVKGLIIICGYYEGVDDRIFQLFPIQKVSLGDFVLSSGELPALAIVESVVRLLPGVVGNDNSVGEDSIISGVLEHPHYTSPRQFHSLEVPGVILSGHHGKIAEWQREKALETTLFCKPKLLLTAALTDKDKGMLTRVLEKDDVSN